MPAPIRVAINRAKLGTNAPSSSIAARPATQTWMQRGLPKWSPIGPRNGCASAYGKAYAVLSIAADAGETAKCAATGRTIGSARRSAKPLAKAQAAKTRKAGTAACGERRAASARAHERFDLGGGDGNVAADQLAAGGGDDGVVFDANADVPVALGNALGRAHVDPGLDGHDHPRLELARRLLDDGATEPVGLLDRHLVRRLVVADIVDVAAEPVARAVPVSYTHLTLPTTRI